jgi:hypothetical protein
MAITNATLTSTTSAIYTSTVTTSTIGNAITTMIFCNTTVYDSANPTTGQSLLTVYAVPSGGSAGNSTMIVNKLPIPAGETVTFDHEKLVLGDGDKIYASTDSLSNITATISTLAV